MESVDVVRNFHSVINRHRVVIAAFCAEDFGVCRSLVESALPVLQREYPEEKGYFFTKIITEEKHGRKINVSLSNAYEIEDHLEVVVFVNGQKMRKENRCWGDAQDQIRTIRKLISEAIAEAGISAEGEISHQMSLLAV